MKRFLPVFLLAFLVSLSLACQAATRLIYGETPTPVPTPTNIPTQTPIPPTPAPTATANPCPNGECIIACVNRLDAIVHPKNKKTPRHNFKDDEEYTLVTYQIDGDQISHPKLDKVPASLKAYQDDQPSQQEIWDYFAAIIPLDQRSFLTHYLVFTDGDENSLAAVAQSENSASQWDLSVDILDTSDPEDLTFTLVHEFGHLLTLNPNQLTPSQAIFDNPDSDSVYEKEEQACPNYFPGEGCSHKDSYINQFFNRFWDKIYDEWLVIDAIEDQDTYDERFDRFYQKYEDQFVTDYAPTSPAEDIAESWAYFILKPKPGNHTLANQKVLFFYEFPELVKLREQIARNLCAQLEK
jgi:hypothetical protein